MARLTKAIKEHIIKKAIEQSGVIATLKECTTEEHALAEKVHAVSWGGAEAYAEAQRKVAEASAILEGVPARVAYFGQARGTVRASFGGLMYYLAFAPNSKRIEPGIRHCEQFTPDHELTEAFKALMCKREAAGVKRCEVRATVRAQVDKVTTVGKLVKVWPEVKGLLPPAQVDKVTTTGKPVKVLGL